MGRALELAPTPPPDPDRARLADLVARREDLVTNIGRESNRLGVTVDPWIAKEIKRLIKALNAHLAEVDARIAALVETCEALARDNRRLRTVKGIGPVVAAVLLARLPELAAPGPSSPEPPPTGQPGGPGPPCQRQRDPPRQTQGLGRPSRGSPRPLHRRQKRQHLRSGLHRLPKAPDRRRKTLQSRHHRLRQKNAHHPRCHVPKRRRLP